MSAAGAGGAGLDVDEVFNTFVATGTGSGALTINNGIDLSGEGGIVWNKSRNNSYNHHIYDPSLGSGGYLQPNTTAALATGANYSFTSTGFQDTYNNISNNDHVWWTFRKAPNFFDIQTWSGNDTAPRTISHNLGCQAGFVVIKDITGSGTDWIVAHRSQSGKVTYLNTTAFFTANYINTLTSSSFTIGDTVLNSTGRNYVAYIFAHNNSDGGFGPSSDQDIIKCGSYTGDGSTNNDINVGFEPQWLMIRNASDSNTSWVVFDSMRGFTDCSTNRLVLNSNGAEYEDASYNAVAPTSTGFKLTRNEQWYNSNTKTYIYMAIRRGPLAEPTSATDVFATDINIGTSTGTNVPYAGFVTDVVVAGNRGSGGKRAFSRLTNRKYMWTYDSAVESTIPLSEMGWDSMTGWTHQQLHASPNVFWQWARAPKFCDVVCYTGSGSAQNVTHNLGAVPEMMWFKRRDISANWTVYHKSIGNDKSLTLNDDKSHFISVGYFNNTTPTESVFSVGANHSVTNNNTNKYICYLFTSLSGISHIGGYTGTGNDLTIDCGFSSGARFVLIKREDRIGGSYGSNGDWYVYDSDRGIVSGNDPYLFLNNTDTEVTNTDYIDPHSSGFTVTSSAPDALNASGGSYIYYAIA